MTGPVIKLNGYRIEEISYKMKTEEPEIGLSTKPDIEVTCGLTDDEKHGIVKISVKVYQEEQNRELYTRISGIFDINEELTDSSLIKEHLAINGTAIIYPYLRSIVSMISTLDSPEAIVLPTVNVNELMQK